MSAILTIFRRELASYFATPVAYVFIVIFLILAGALTFYLGNFYERGQADLQPFFSFHLWLYLFLIPAISMRLWSEERKSGSIELLLTLPVTMLQAVLGKFLAAFRIVFGMSNCIGKFFKSRNETSLIIIFRFRIWKKPVIVIIAKGDMITNHIAFGLFRIPHFF